jgi:hypothetical protein
MALVCIESTALVVYSTGRHTNIFGRYFWPFFVASGSNFTLWGGMHCSRIDSTLLSLSGIIICPVLPPFDTANRAGVSAHVYMGRISWHYISFFIGRYMINLGLYITMWTYRGIRGSGCREDAEEMNSRGRAWGCLWMFLRGMSMFG